MTRVEQLWYTWTKDGTTGRRGFQVRAASPGFADDQALASAADIVCSRPPSGTAAGWLDHGPYRVAFKAVDAGETGDERDGNFFAHVLGGTRGQLPLAIVAAVLDADILLATDDPHAATSLPTFELPHGEPMTRPPDAHLQHFLATVLSHAMDYGQTRLPPTAGAFHLAAALDALPAPLGASSACLDPPRKGARLYQVVISSEEYPNTYTYDPNTTPDGAALRAAGLLLKAPPSPLVDSVLGASPDLRGFALDLLATVRAQQGEVDRPGAVRLVAIHASALGEFTSAEGGLDAFALAVASGDPTAIAGVEGLRTAHTDTTLASAVARHVPDMASCSQLAHSLAAAGSAQVAAHLLGVVLQRDGDGASALPVARAIEALALLSRVFGDRSDVWRPLVTSVATLEAAVREPRVNRHWQAQMLFADYRELDGDQLADLVATSPEVMSAMASTDRAALDRLIHDGTRSGEPFRWFKAIRHLQATHGGSHDLLKAEWALVPRLSRDLRWRQVLRLTTNPAIPITGVASIALGAWTAQLAQSHAGVGLVEGARLRDLIQVLHSTGDAADPRVRQLVMSYEAMRTIERGHTWKHAGWDPRSFLIPDPVARRGLLVEALAAIDGTCGATSNRPASLVDLAHVASTKQGRNLLSLLDALQDGPTVRLQAWQALLGMLSPVRWSRKAFPSLVLHLIAYEIAVGRVETAWRRVRDAGPTAKEAAGALRSNYLHAGDVWSVELVGALPPAARQWITLVKKHDDQ